MRDTGLVKVESVLHKIRRWDWEACSYGGEEEGQEVAALLLEGVKKVYS